MSRIRSIAVLPILLAVLIASGCGASGSATTGTMEGDSDVGGRDLDGSAVTGTVTYRERIALTPGAKLIVRIRDTTYIDAASELVAEQVITDAGQVPISFEVPYDPDDIDSRNRYSVSARIEESDGRLAFINDTAYDVITDGNPTKVDMVLVLVEPPPEMDDDEWRSREEPVHVTGAELVWEGDRALVHVFFAVSRVEGCYSIGREEAAVNGSRVVVDVMARVPPASWGINCSDRDLELDSYIHLGNAGDTLVRGETYTVEVNGQESLALAVPESQLEDS